MCSLSNGLSLQSVQCISLFHNIDGDDGASCEYDGKHNLIFLIHPAVQTIHLLLLKMMSTLMTHWQISWSITITKYNAFITILICSQPVSSILDLLETIQ